MKLGKEKVHGNNVEGLSKFRLINGTYTADEAREILLTLLNNKISFHERHLLTCQERNENDRLKSEERIEQVRDAARMVEEMIADARKAGASVSVESIANIRINY